MSKETNKAKNRNLYYLQNTTATIGNAMLWWRDGDAGYCCEIREAKVFTAEEAWNTIGSDTGKFKMWDKARVDAKISHHVEEQHLA